MKKLRIAASILLTAVMLFSLTACHVVWDQPAQYGIYPEDVMVSLGLHAEDLKPAEIAGYSKDVFRDTGLDVPLFGTDFDFILELGKYGTVRGFSYHVFLEDKKEAAKVIAALSAETTKLYGESIDWICSKKEYCDVEEHTAEDMEKLFDDYPYGIEGLSYTATINTMNDVWDLVPTTREGTVLNHLWDQGIQERLVVSALYRKSGVRIILDYHPVPGELADSAFPFPSITDD